MAFSTVLEHPGQWLSIGPSRLKIPAGGTLTASDYPGIGLETTLTLGSTDLELRVYAVGVRATPPRQVTPSDLREVRVRELMGETLPQHIRTAEFEVTRLNDVDFIQAVREGGPSSADTMTIVGDLFCIGRAIGVAPAKHVQHTLNLSPATTSRWIRRARELGYIEDEG